MARARSAFRMEAVTGAEREPFETIARRAIELEAEGRPDWRARVYLQMGCYGRWLGEILDRFPAEQRAGPVQGGVRGRPGRSI